LSASRPSPERRAFWCANESKALINAVNGGILGLKKESGRRDREYDWSLALDAYRDGYGRE